MCASDDEREMSDLLWSISNRDEKARGNGIPLQAILPVIEA